MSQPIRYGLADEHLGRIHPAKDGHLVMWADYAALASENERLRKAGDAMADEMYILRNKVEWLRLAEHLVIWDGEKWVVRHEHGGKPL